MEEKRKGRRVELPSLELREEMSQMKRMLESGQCGLGLHLGGVCWVTLLIPQNGRERELS